MENYAPTTDRKGQSLQPGDKVSFKVRNGTFRGTVTISTRAQEQLPDGSWAPALTITTDDGTVYGLISKGTLKLAGQ